MQKQTILMIDNYDSFTYNVVHLIYKSLGEAAESFEIKVMLNDKITLEEISELNPCCIFISPGPCSPNEAGICLKVIEQFYKSIPMFGVCLGHQAICQFFGGSIVRVEPFHGRASNILIETPKCKIFEGIESGFEVIRYHSLALDKSTLPAQLQITSTAQQDGVVMSVAHKTLPIFGVQFHPESVLSTMGEQIFANFFRITGIYPS